MFTTYRYIRPVYLTWPGRKYKFHNNLYGITMRFDVDSEKTVTVRFSVCSGVNFIKEEGRKRASESKVKVVLSKKLHELNESLVDATVHELNTLYPEYEYDVLTCYKKDYDCYQRLANLIRRAMRTPPLKEQEIYEDVSRVVDELRELESLYRNLKFTLDGVINRAKDVTDQIYKFEDQGFDDIELILEKLNYNDTRNWMSSSEYC